MFNQSMGYDDIRNPRADWQPVSARHNSEVDIAIPCNLFSRNIYANYRAMVTFSCKGRHEPGADIKSDADFIGGIFC